MNNNVTLPWNSCSNRNDDRRVVVDDDNRRYEEERVSVVMPSMMYMPRTNMTQSPFHVRNNNNDILLHQIGEEGSDNDDTSNVLSIIDAALAIVNEGKENSGTVMDMDNPNGNDDDDAVHCTTSTSSSSFSSKTNTRQ